MAGLEGPSEISYSNSPILQRRQLRPKEERDWPGVPPAKKLLPFISLFFKLSILFEVELHAVLRKKKKNVYKSTHVLFAPSKTDPIFASESEMGEGCVCMRV